MSRLTLLLSRISGSFWFAPALIALGMSGLAFLALEVDRGSAGRIMDFVPMRLDVDGARVVLSTIAGGMMTVTSIVFSLTFVALTTMSSQLGPRILLFFMHDRPTQVVLGAFVGVFVFALVALLGAGGGIAAPPTFSLGLAMIMSACAFGLMIYFVHHIAESLQADVVVARLGEQLRSAIENVSERDEGEQVDEAMRRRFDSAETHPIAAPVSGYVQYIDIAGLLEAAERKEFSIELLARPADFCVAGDAVARGAGDKEAIEKAVVAAFIFGERRSPSQQAHFEITALTEVAVRALSPGVNDPYTAAACIDRLLDGLVHAARRLNLGDAAHCKDGRVLLIERRYDFADHLDAAFSQIRAHSRTDPLVLMRMVTAYETLERLVEGETERRMVAEAVEGLRADIDRRVDSERDRTKLLEQADRTLAALSNAAG